MVLALCFVALAVLAPAHWISVWRDSRRVEQVTKPLALAALIAVALALGAADSGVGRLVLAALVLALVGDVFLLGGGPTVFVAGLAAFLVGNLAWVVALAGIGFRWLPGLLAALVVLAVLRTGGDRIRAGAGREGGPWLAGATTAYMLVLGALVVTGAGTGRVLVVLGAACFLVSDLVLGLDRFVAPRPRAGFVVMVTYHVGQALMVVGALR